MYHSTRRAAGEKPPSWHPIPIETVLADLSSAVIAKGAQAVVAAVNGHSTAFS